MFKDTPLLMIDTPEALRRLVASLASEPVIAVDTEADSFHHYQEKLCLIQLSDPTRDVIIDPLAVHDLSPLADVFANPDIVKVLHGADYDVVSMKRDHGLQVRGIFDTMLAAQFLGLPRIGLADLIERYFGISLDKRYQRHDWALRPLQPEHLEYARGDTHWLLALREVLTVKLERVGRLGHLLEECALVEDRQWGGRSADPTVDFQRIKGHAVLDEAGRRVLRALAVYRDASAREMDRPAFKVIPDDRLIELAMRRPDDMDGLLAVLRPGSALARRHANGLYEAMRQGLTDTTPLPSPRASAPRGAPATPQLPSAPGGGDRVLGPLKAWRNEVVQAQGLNPAVVANNQVLKEIARLAPTTVEALAEVPGIRSWQVQEFGEAIVALVSKVLDDRPVARPRRRRRRR